MKVFPVAAFAAAFTGALLSGCASLDGGAKAAAPTTRPALVVLIVIDGLPMRQITQFRQQFGPDGFARFLDRGAWFANAHYGHAFTVTAAGHATVLTGAYPWRTGIIGNDWRDPATGELVYNTGDAAESYIGHPTKKLDGTSPRRLKAETLGDVLRGLDPRSKVIGVSGKDRGAILPAGHQGQAYMYQSTTGQFASTSYYMKEHPAWVQAFNAAKPAASYFKTEWRPILAEDAYAQSLPDNQAWFTQEKRSLPMRMGRDSDAAPTAPYYADLLRSPFADQMSLDFAYAAVQGEQLGADDAPDILSVSLSAHDYINHAFSAESRLSQDHLLHLDRMLAAFFARLDATVGKDRYLIALSADHGFTPAPPYLASRGRDGGRITGAELVGRLNQGLSARLGAGEGKWLHGLSGATLLLNKALLAEKGVPVERAAELARELLLTEPGLLTAFTRAELLAAEPPPGLTAANTALYRAMRHAWHPDVSGEVQYALKPGWMFGGGAVATHGSPHAEDTHVPLLFYGPAWLKPGMQNARVEVADLAPTLARVLHVRPPAQAQGRALREALTAPACGGTPCPGVAAGQPSEQGPD